MITGNEPATGYGFCTADGQNVQEVNGLTIRQHFAAIAMQGILAQQPNTKDALYLQAKYYAEQYPDHTLFQAVAAESVGMADALIAELNKPQSPQPE